MQHSLHGKGFVASYSGGKDSMLAIYRAIALGLRPVSIVTTYNINQNRSWFHGVPEPVLRQVSASIGIPIALVPIKGEDYGEKLGDALIQAKQQGAEVCVFGDIDIEGHFTWCDSLCKSIGMRSFFPLWKEPRADLVREFIDNGFKTLITVVDTERLPETVIGKTLTWDVAQAIARHGADICGENGEYHTFTYDGPLFRTPLQFHTGEPLRQGQYAILPVEADGDA